MRSKVAFEIVIDDLLGRVRVEPVHDVAHAGGERRGADEIRDQSLDLAVVEDHRVRPVAQPRWAELRCRSADGLRGDVD
jgi:hypothetical protein